MGTFAVPATLANPRNPERRVTVDLMVDSGATWTLLPAQVVKQLELAMPWERSVTLASGEQVTYPTGEVVVRLGGDELTTIFLAGPPGSLGLLGAVTLEQFGVAPDPVRRILVPVSGFLAASAPRR